MDLNTYRAIAEQASHQLGLITRAQLHGNDVSDKAIARMAGAMAIEPIGSRTFRLAGVSPSFDQRVMAACLDTGGVASHRTAAALHGLSGLAQSPDIEVTIVHHRRHSTSRIARVHSTTNLPPDDLVNVGPIPTTGVARTFLGLAALVPEVSSETIRTAIGDAVREGKVSDAWLWWRLERLRCRGRNGVTVLEKILSRRQKLGPTESWLEHTFLDLLDAAGLPLPIVQRRIAHRGHFAARVDTLYPHLALVIELDGHAHHSSREDRVRDERRRRRLVLLGHRVMVFTYDDLVDEPDEVVADVIAALGAEAAA